MSPKSAFRLMLAICLLVLLAVSGSQAQITPSSDAYTSTLAPSTNYGGAIALVVDGAKQTSYIQFNLASIPAGASVSQATLKLFVHSVTKAGTFNVDYVNACQPFGGNCTYNETWTLPTNTGSSPLQEIYVFVYAVPNAQGNPSPCPETFGSTTYTLPPTTTNFSACGESVDIWVQNAFGAESEQQAFVYTNAPPGYISASPTSLTFSCYVLGNPYCPPATQAITVTPLGYYAPTGISIAATGNFSQTNDCPSSLVPGNTCTITVSFNPSGDGTYNGLVNITGNFPTFSLGLTGTESF